MKFREYQHIERLCTVEVEDIWLGEVYIFPKIDGTNGSVWFSDDGFLAAGNKSKQLMLSDDNSGFYAAMLDNNKIKHYLTMHPKHRLYGEWLVPHTLRTYRKDAWRKFYIFDVATDIDTNDTSTQDAVSYLPYQMYKPMLDEFELDYIPPITVITRGTKEQFYNQLEKNVFLIEDGKDTGEGIILKNYDFVNKYGRTVWAKIVKSEFKEKHIKIMGAPRMKGKETIESKIAEQFVTGAIVDKVRANIATECDGWRSKYIARLLHIIYHDIVVEEIWNILKKYKGATIDFRLLQKMVCIEVKKRKPELF